MDMLEYMMLLEERRRTNLARRMMCDMMFYGDGPDADPGDISDNDNGDETSIRLAENRLNGTEDTSVLEDSPTKQPNMISRWSEEGKLLCNEADDYKERGNKAFGDKAYGAAIALYTTGLKNATQVGNNNEQVGLLCSNRSHMLCCIHEYEQAVVDARLCIKCKPKWYKGYMRLIDALKGQDKFKDAIEVAVESMTKLRSAPDDQLHILIELLKMLPGVQDMSHFNYLKIPKTMWSRAFKKLVSLKEWKTICFLILGNDDCPPLLPQECYTAADMKLSDLVTSCSVDNWKSWGQRSTIKLLQAGARMDELSPDGKAAAHAALRVGIRTGVYDLLKHLFLRYIPMGDRDRSDDNGDTLLHLACRENFPTKLKAVKLLLEHKVNPTCRNNANKRPLDLLPEDDPERASIIQAMVEKDFDKSCLMEAPDVAKETNQTQQKPFKCKPVDVTTVKSAPNQRSTSLEADQVSASAASTQDPKEQEPSSLLSKIYHGSSSRCQIWTRTEVERWIKDNNLTEIEDKLSGLCGPQLSELHLLQLNTPAAFYQLLYDHLHLSLTQLLRVSAAVRNLH